MICNSILGRELNRHKSFDLWIIFPENVCCPPLALAFEFAALWVQYIQQVLIEILILRL